MHITNWIWLKKTETKDSKIMLFMCNFARENVSKLDLSNYAG
jgi:hypothetical protein